MSTELNLEAEGAARVEGLLDALDAMQRDPALCKYHGVLRHAELTIAARRAAPSAPMVEELPALPTEAQLRHALKEIPLCYPWGTGRKLVREGTSLDWVSQRESTGSNTQLADMNKNFVNSTIAATVAVMTSYIAPYAERIRVLERELATFKAEHATQQTAQSIDDDKTFWSLMRKWYEAYQRGPAERLRDAACALIAHINGQTAGAVDAARRAALEEAAQWLDFFDGKGMRRAEAIRALAAAPSPQHGKEGGN